MPDSLAMLERLVAQAGDLYSLPRVAAEVLELTRDPQFDARRLKNCLENDPALTAKLLRVVNSSLFGLTRNVRDLNQAIALLGTTPLKLLVLGFCLPEGLFQGLGAEFLGRYWQRTLITAVAARQIAEEVWKIPGDEPFLAGLLRELGLLVLLQDIGEPYARFYVRIRDTGLDLCQAERAAIGFDHIELTSRLLAAWQLPETIVAAAGLPRDASQFDRLPPTKRALPQILHLAGLLAEVLGEGRTDLWPELLEAGRRCHDLPRHCFNLLVETIEDKVKQLAEVLALQLPDARRYRDVLAEAHQRLTEVAGEAAELLAAPRGKCDQETTLWDETRSLTAAALAATQRTGSPSAASTATALRHAALEQPQGISRSASAVGTSVLDLDDPALATHTASMAERCRKRRQALSLILAEFAGHDDFVRPGASAWKPSSRRLEKLLFACRRLDAGAQCLIVADGLVAVLLPGADRQAAVHTAGELLETVRSWPPTGATAREPARLHIGVAAVQLIPKNFSPDDLISAAQRCLFAARGAGAVKSIEL